MRMLLAGAHIPSTLLAGPTSVAPLCFRHILLPAKSTGGALGAGTDKQVVQA